MARRLENISDTMCKEEAVRVFHYSWSMGSSSTSGRRRDVLSLVNQRAAASSAHMRRKKKLTPKSGWFRQDKKDDSNSFVMFQTPMDQQVTARPGQFAWSHSGEWIGSV